MAAGSEALGLPVTNPSLKPYGTKEGRIYAGMGVMPGSSMYWTSGNNPAVINKDAPITSYDNRGDMHTQAHNTLAQLKENLATVGLTLADVVYVRAFLGPDWNMGGKFDFDGWNKAYGEFFNNPDQPHKPARVTVTTPTFAANAGGHPNTMIEVEFVAAFPKAPSLFDGPAVETRALRQYGAPTANVASGVAVKPHSAFYVSGGALPSIGGDMKTQALSALESLKSRLAEAGMNFRDVVFMRAYLVPDADGTVDRDGWNAAYTTFFNNPEQPHKPARVTIPVYSLPKSESKIAIDIIAVGS
jgi:enamine deaminase RidA (YjgF/YER057c/UK114 family)